MEPFKSLRSGISLSQGGCGPPPGISPGIGVLPRATIPPTTVIVPTPGARLIALQSFSTYRYVQLVHRFAIVRRLALELKPQEHRPRAKALSRSCASGEMIKVGHLDDKGPTCFRSGSYNGRIIVLPVFRVGRRSSLCTNSIFFHVNVATFSSRWPDYSPKGIIDRIHRGLQGPRFP